MVTTTAETTHIQHHGHGFKKKEVEGVRENDHTDSSPQAKTKTCRQCI